MRDFHANLSTGQWPVLVSPVDGATCHTHAIILVPKRVESKEYLDTACHECLHASNPEWTEECVTRTAKDLAEVLWRLGYRLPKPVRVVKKADA